MKEIIYLEVEGKMKRLIKKIIRNKSNDQLLITIPLNFKDQLKEGDYVEILKVPAPIVPKEEPKQDEPKTRYPKK